jgi:hypothetical protein
MTEAMSSVVRLRALVLATDHATPPTVEARAGDKPLAAARRSQTKTIKKFPAASV